MARKNSILKTGIVLASSYLIMGELIYEGALNKKVLNTLKNRFREIEPEALSFYNENPDSYASGDAWFTATNPEKRVTMMPDGTSVYANIIESTEPSDVWTIVTHGYTSCPRAMSGYGYGFHKMGHNVLFPILRGHSISESRYCSMGYHDKNIILEWIKFILEINPNAKIILFGTSMGAATTMLTTGENLPDNIKCAIADCGFTSCWEEYASQLKKVAHLPPFPFLYAANTVSKLRKNFDFKKCSPIKAVAKSKTPTLFIHGENDEFVPYYMMDKLYNACSAQKEKLSVPDARHNESYEIHPEMYWKKVKEFTEKFV